MINADGVQPMDDIPTPDETPEPPVPLTARVPIPAFPTDALPPPIADMVGAIAEATQTDPAMAGVSALSALSACTGGYAMIQIRGAWQEPLHLYTNTIAISGERKSAVQRFMVTPLIGVEIHLAKGSEAKRVEAQALKEAAMKAVDKQRNVLAGMLVDHDATDADRNKAQEELLAATAFANSVDVPAITRILADDITPEAAATLLADQGGRLAIISAEGGIFDIIAGRYSKKPNMDLWLKGHSGDMLRVDRKDRAPEHIPRPALTLGLMTQPIVLSEIASQREFRGRGLLARFLYAYPVSKVGRRNVEPADPAQAVIDAYDKTIANLITGMIEWASDPMILTVTDDGKKRITAIAAEIEPTLAGDGEMATMADWGSKFVGAVTRIAGILHLATHGHEGYDKPVTSATIQAAYRIGRYFKACAVNAFAEMGADQVSAEAAYLLDRIERLDVDELSERDIHREARSRFPTKAEMASPLARLIDHGYLIKIETPKENRPGRQPSPRYKVVRS
ncbi:MAG TPA: YfjI family protein [Mycobacterium sp.]|uniref:YfjI family protein n=1 Tax=Mycobacterium sp. TaxID=1785 RepID=UPI002C550DA2|nr:YfjI family protein [Mycobacterium sp.]HME78913.1 YfjI family protein [Mycobacterium sp.]